MRRAVVRDAGHTLYGSESNRLGAARTTETALPRRGVVLTSRCGDYLLALIQ